jgi:hypothetical protein
VEFRRQYRVLDQMLSAHSVLRDRYAKKALWLTVGLLALAVTLNAFVFVSDDVLGFFGGDPEGIRVWLGIVSVAILALSIAEFKVDWQGRASIHEDATRRLADLKAEFRAAKESLSEGHCESVLASLSRDYSKVMDLLPPIPESQFIPLKARHLRKVRMSRELDDHPGVPLMFRRIENCWRDTRAWRLSRKRNAPTNGVPTNNG